MPNNFTFILRNQGDGSFRLMTVSPNSVASGILNDIQTSDPSGSYSIQDASDATFSRVNQPFQEVTATTTTTINFEDGNNVLLAMNANITTLTLSNPRDGEHYVIRLTQDVTGSRTVSWPATVIWKGGSAPTLGGSNVVDVVSMIYDDTNTEYLADAGLAFA